MNISAKLPIFVSQGSFDLKSKLCQECHAEFASDFCAPEDWEGPADRGGIKLVGLLDAMNLLVWIDLDKCFNRVVLITKEFQACLLTCFLP